MGNLREFLAKLLGKVGEWMPSKTITLYNDKIPSTPTGLNEPVNDYKAPQVKGTADSYAATPTPTPTQQYQTGGPNIKGAVSRFAGNKYSPMFDYIPVVEEAVNNIDFWKNNPYLPIVLAQLETGMGQNITRPNNLINYGIRSPEINALFEQVGIEEALRRSLREIGDTGNTYSRFRTGKPLSDEEILSFGQTYEPMNPDYPQNLLNGIRELEMYLGGDQNG